MDGGGGRPAGSSFFPSARLRHRRALDESHGAGGCDRKLSFEGDLTFRGLGLSNRTQKPIPGPRSRNRVLCLFLALSHVDANSSWHGARTA